MNIASSNEGFKYLKDHTCVWEIAILGGHSGLANEEREDVTSARDTVDSESGS